jgi:hypothetical protein
MTDPEPPTDAAFGISEVEGDGPGSVIAIGRCHTALRLTARFGQIRDSAEEIALSVTRIRFYGSLVEELDAGCSARVTLQGTGAHLLEPGHVIEGVNPPALS